MSRIEDVTDTDLGNWSQAVSRGRVEEPDGNSAYRGMDVQVRNPNLPMGLYSNPYTLGSLVATAAGIALGSPMAREGIQALARDLGQGSKSLIATGYNKAKDYITTKWRGGASKTTKQPLAITAPPGSAYESPPPSNLALIPYTGATALDPAKAIGTPLSSSSRDSLAPSMTGYDLLATGVKGYHPLADTYYEPTSRRRGRGSASGINSLAFQGFGGGGTMDPSIARTLAQAQARTRSRRY